MKNRSITFKLFIITAAFFAIFISVQLILQTAFFEEFYINRKMRMLERSLDAFKINYISKNVSLTEIMKEMTEIGEENNAEVAIVNNADNFSIITGSTQGQGNLGKTEIMRAAIAQWSLIARAHQGRLIRGETITYTIRHPEYNTNNIVKISPIVVSGRVENVIIAVTSLQPVGEAFSAVKEFYIYIYAAAIFLIIVLSFIYSNMISKPLLDLNKAASRMAELDFSVRCDISGHDEIGDLAGTLNFLSQKLNNTLDELKGANEKLRADIEKERSLEKMRREFVAGVSHELKTPITLIEGYAEGLKENIAEGERRDFYIDVIIDEAEKMGRLVSDMLDLARLDSGNYKLNPEEFFIDELVGSVIRKYSNKFRDKAIDLKYNNPESNIMVTGDRFRIEQVIVNFISNAVRHTPDGGIIRVNMENMETEALVEVENQGEHIEDKDLVNIWEKFYKVEKSRNRDSGGTGLGLSISRDILELHKSKYGVSNTSLGVKFYFTLQRAE